MGSKLFTSIWDVSQCSQYCDAQTKYNLATAPKDGTPAKVCKFFNTYLLQAKLANGTIVPQGQYCSLYTESWPKTYATNSGQWRGQDQYTVDYSFGFSKIASASDIDPTVGDVNGAKYQAVADIKWSSLQPFCSSYLGYTTPVSTFVATATLTPTSTSIYYTTTTVAAMRKRQDYTNSTYPGLTTDSSVGGAVLVDDQNVTWYDPNLGTMNDMSKRAVSVAIPGGLAKYKPAVISAACCLQVKPVSLTSVLTASTTVTGSATVSVKTVISTTIAAAQTPSIDNLIVSVPGAPWIVPGYSKGSSPLELYDYGPDANIATKPYGYVNLANDPNRKSHAYPARFSLDSSTARLKTIKYGTVVTASSYTPNLSPDSFQYVVFLPDSFFGQSYSPLRCYSDDNGLLDCALTDPATGQTIFDLAVKGGTATSAGTLAIVGGSAAMRLSQTGAWEASVSFSGH